VTLSPARGKAKKKLTATLSGKRKVSGKGVLKKSRAKKAKSAHPRERKFSPSKGIFRKKKRKYPREDY